MDIFLALILGVVQGITEFLPISSTGHLILVRSAFSISSGHALAIDAVLHLATAGAVVLYFWKDIVGFIHVALRMLGRLPVDERDKTLLFALLVGTIPAIFFGLLLEDLMATLFRNPLLVAGVLVVGSFIFAYAEYVHEFKPRQVEMSVPLGLKIGFFQVLALFPGMSRSGITIAGGLLLGMQRYDAARFAFLLSIPVILGAGSKKLLELITAQTGAIDWVSLYIAAAAAFFIGLGAIHFMLGFVKNNSLWPFIWYRILLATFVVLLVYFG